MRQYIYLSLVIATLFLCTNCVEEVDQNLLKNENRLAIDALITDKPGPYFVRLSKGARHFSRIPGTQSDSYLDAQSDASGEATVIITDDQGNKDVLEPVDPQEIAGGPNTFNRGCRGDFYNVVYDRFYRTTTAMLGTPGRTYTLTVLHEGREYKATTTMPLAAPAITKATLAVKTLQSVRGSKHPFYVPQISFKDPQPQENYYMFFANHLRENLNMSNNAWTMLYPTFIIFDDKFFNGQVNNLDIVQKIHDNYLDCVIRQYPIPSDVDPAFTTDLVVEMHSITKEAYEYYQALNKQLESDGGAYSAAPASPPGSFNNGALGLFRASGIRKVTIPYFK